jgi:transcriptional regulator with XRE-family HTH domain
MNIDDVIAKLKKRQGKRSQEELAKELRVSGAYLSDVLTRKRAPGPAILEALGIIRRTEYNKEGK